MSQELHRDIGRLEEAVDTLKAEVSTMRAELGEIKAIVAQAKGGWRTLIAVGSIAGAIGAALMKALAAVKGAG